jgi:hypothetical protein
MASDDTQLSEAVGTSGDVIRTLEDADGKKWQPVVCAYALTISPGSNSLQIVDSTHGLPVNIIGSVAVTGTFWQATQPVSGIFWQATQPISAAALPLPSGAATLAKQPALGTAGTAAADVITVQGIASMTALKVDGSAVTQPVSGSVAVSNFPIGFLAAQSGTWTVGVSGSVAVTGTFWQATQPVSGTFWQATQPVSIASAIAVTDNSGSLTVDAPVGAPAFVRLSDGSAAITTLPVSIASVPSHDVTNAGTFAVQVTSLPSGLATSANQDTGNTSLSSINGKIPALGQALAAGSVPIVLTAAQLTTLTPPAAIAGFATETTLSTLNGKVTACNTGAVTISAALPAGTNAIGKLAANSGVTIGAVEIAASQIVGIAAGSAVIGHVIVDSGAITATLSAETTKVIGTVNIAAAQTVGLVAGTAVIGHVIVDSGTLASTQSGTWTVGLSAAQTLATVTTVGTVTTITNVVHVDDNSGSLTVDNNGTFAVQAAQSGTWTVQPGNTANTTPWLANESDPAATTGTISAADAGTTSTANSNGQTVVTGSATANSSVSCTLSAHSGVTLQLTGTGTTSGTFAVERSIDGGTTFTPFSMELVSVGASGASWVITDNNALILRGNVGEMTTVRVRCTSKTFTSFAVKWQPGFGASQVIANQGPPNSSNYPWTISMAQVGGSALVAEDAVATTTPVPVGLVARRARITAMSADGDIVRATGDRYGRTQIVGVDLTVTFLQVTASGDTDFVAAPAGGSRLKLLRIEASNSHASTAVVVGLKSNSIFANAVFGKKYLPAAGGMAVWVFPNGHLLCGDAEKLVANLSAAGQVEMTAYYETIAT